MSKSKVAHCEDVDESESISSIAAKHIEQKLISKNELSSHMSASSAWISIEGKVFDVTEFLNDHPGGIGVLLSKCGKDATDEFLRVGHSPEARKRMINFEIGKLDANVPYPGGTQHAGRNIWANPDGSTDIGEGECDVDTLTFGPPHALGFFGVPTKPPLAPIMGVEWPRLDPEDRYTRWWGLLLPLGYIFFIGFLGKNIPRSQLVHVVVCSVVIKAVLAGLWQLANSLAGQESRMTSLLQHMSRWQTHCAGLCLLGFLLSSMLVYDDIWGLLQAQLCALACFDMVVYPGSLVAARRPRPVLAARLQTPVLLLTALYMKVRVLGFMTPLRALVCGANGLCLAGLVHTRGPQCTTPLRDTAITIAAALPLVFWIVLVAPFVDLHGMLGAASVGHPGEQTDPEGIRDSLNHLYSTWTSLVVAVAIAYLSLVEAMLLGHTCDFASGAVSVFNTRYLLPNLIARGGSVILMTLTWRWAGVGHLAMGLLQFAGVWLYQHRVVSRSFADLKSRVQDPADLEMASGLLACVFLIRGSTGHWLSLLISVFVRAISYIGHPDTRYYFHPSPVARFPGANVKLGIAYSVTPLDEQRKPKVFQCNVGCMETDDDWVLTNRHTYKMLKQLSTDPNAGRKGFVVDFVAEFSENDPITKQLSTKQFNFSAWSSAKASQDWFHASKAHKQIVKQFQSKSEGGGLQTFSALLAQLEPSPDRPLRWVVKCSHCNELVHGYPEVCECAGCGREVHMPLM